MLRPAGALLGQCGNILFTSPGAKTVLIHADHRRRDAAASLLIGYYLKELGYNVVIGNRFLSRTWYYLFRPEVVLTTHPGTIFTADELAEESKSCRFVLMHPESSGMIRDAMLEHMRGASTDAFTRHYTRVLTWGPVLKEWIVEAGLYSAEQVDVVGCARYDFYRSQERPPLMEQTLGAMSSFTGISTHDHGNPLKQINAGRQMRGIHFGRAGGYEDYLWASAAYVRLFLEFLDVWCLELRRSIDFRPYTLEALEDHAFFRQRYQPYLRQDVDSPFPQWLTRRCANVFCYSSSVIESIISGVPYLTLQGLVEERLEYHQPRLELPETRGEIYDYTYKPATVAELVDLAMKAEVGDLPLRVRSEDSPGLRKLLWDYYGWPQAKPSSELVADAIHRLIETTPFNHSNTRWRLMQQVAKNPAKMWILSNKGRTWKTFSDTYFLPWHQGEKAYAWRAWKRLRAAESVQ